MQRLILTRQYKPEATIGELKSDNGVHICYTLERPNLNNAKDNPNTPENESSCIPEGEYVCKKYKSPKYPDHWEITGVKGRDKILWHSANKINQLLGCIAPATKIIDGRTLLPKGSKIKPEEVYFASESKKALEALRTFVKNQDFNLAITSAK